VGVKWLKAFFLLRKNVKQRNKITPFSLAFMFRTPYKGSMETQNGAAQKKAQTPKISVDMRNPTCYIKCTNKEHYK